MRERWNKLVELCKKNKKLLIITILLTILTYIVVFFVFFYEKNEPDEITYNEFLQLVEEKKVDTVYYNKSKEYMTITLFNEDTKNMTKEERDDYQYEDCDKRRVLYPGSQDFRENMLKADVNMVLQTDNMFFQQFGSIFLIMCIYIMGFSVLMRIMVPGGRVTEKDVIQTTDVTFDDIIGHDEIIDDIKFITELIKNPDKGKEVGVQIPKGILLDGPPGTGKTLLAKAIAHEAGVPFLNQNASGLIEMYVGLGAKRVRGLFKIARKKAPCVVFIDEIDAVGAKRGKDKNSSENDQTINALLQEMDGFNGREGIFIIAATNRADTLDEALVRSGRFDRKITVNPPRDWTVRRDLFEHYLGKFKCSETIDIDTLAKQTPGFTGADIAMVCNEASIVAIMHNKEEIDTACIEEAIDKKVFNGNRSKTEAPEDDRNIVAYHEAGHAVMHYILGEPIARASIQATTSGVGGVVFGVDKGTMFTTRKMLRDMVLVGYAGRVSEEIKFGTENITTGARNDIEQATDIITSYIEKYGFDEDFGLLSIGVLADKHLIDSKYIVNRSSTISKELYAECRELLSENYEKVELLAKALLKHETMSGADIKTLLEG